MSIRRASELDRLVATYAPFAARGVPIVGLEPSCLLTLRDELLSLRSDDDAKSVSAHALLFEEFLVREAEAGRLQLAARRDRRQGAGAWPLPPEIVRRVQAGREGAAADPGSEVETIESSCCGMAGAFGYGADTYQASMEMAELSLLPAVRRADAGDASSSPTAPRAGTRSRTAPRAKRSMSRACWR